jgi:ATP-dependent Clp protease ATP-binding subunit ClpX
MIEQNNPESADPKNEGRETTLENKDSELKNPNLLPTPNELIELLSLRVIGQNQAKQSIAVAAYQHLMNCAASDLYGGRVEAENHVMIVGPTGTGKSLLLRTLGDVLKVPMFYIPCTTISPDGYKGKNLSQHLDCIANLITDDEFTRPAIVVWDEVDKLSLYGDADSAAAVYRRMTQMDFLTYLDGTKCGSEGEMDSSRILSICCGAFSGLDEIRNPNSKPIIGFQSGEITKRTQMPPVMPAHLIEYGLIPEFVGRFSRITSLDPLDQCALRRILTEAHGNVLARRKRFFALHGVRLEITDDAIDALVAKALLQNTGARALRLVVDQVLRGTEHRLPDMAEAGVTALVIDRDTMLGITPPIEHKGQRMDLSTLIEVRKHAAYAKAGETAAQENDDICIF